MMSQVTKDGIDFDKAKAFLDEYKVLCDKHDLGISSCGCCCGPNLVLLGIAFTSENLYNHLIELKDEPIDRSTSSKEIRLGEIDPSPKRSYDSDEYPSGYPSSASGMM